MVDVPSKRRSPVGRSRNNAVTIVEEWESVDALETHVMAPHMLKWRKTVKQIVVNRTLAILEPA